MAIQTINVGQLPNDGTGDDLREAFVKVNNNILELDNRTANPPITGENLTSLGENIFAGETDNVFKFRTIKAGSNVSFVSNQDSITLQADGGIDNILVITNDGSLTFDDSKSFYIQGKDLVSVKTANSDKLEISIQNSGIVSYDTNPTLSQNLDADFNSIANVETINAATLTGNLEGNVYDIDVRDINAYFVNYWDFGAISENEFKSILDYIIFQTDVDMGTFNEPGSFDIDLGSIA